MLKPLDAISVIAFTIVFLLTFILLGSLIRILLNMVTKRVTRQREDVDNLDAFEMLSLDVALATVVVPLLTLVATWTGSWLCQRTVYVIVAALSLARVYIMWREEKLTLCRVKKLLRKKSPSLRSFNTVFCFILLLVFFLRLSPLVGLYVSPGDDAKMHALYTLMITENHGYPVKWGRYAPGSYADSPVCYMLGFHSINAFLYFLTGVPHERCVMITTNIYNALIVLSAYFLSKNIFKNKYAGLASAIFIGLVSSQPLDFFAWGGNAELAADFILLMFLGFYYKMSSTNNYSAYYIGTCVLLLIGIFYTHLLSICYALCCIGPYLLYKILTQRHIKDALYAVFILGASLTAAIPMLINSIMINSTPEKIRTLEHLASWWWRDKQILGAQMLSLNSLQIILNNLRFWLVPTLFMFLGALSLTRIKNVENGAIYTIGWTALLFAIYENGPYGLYFIKIPMWYNLLPDRFLLATCLPISCIAGFGAYYIFKKRLDLTEYQFANVTKAHSRNLWKVYCGVLVLILGLQLLSNISYMYQARELSAVTVEDYAAFMWIKENIPEDATIYVTEADAGQWIPTISQRRGFIQFIHQSEDFYTIELRNDSATLGYLMQMVPDDDLVLQLLDKYDVQYVYVGEKSIFGRRKLNSTLLLNATHYKLIYHVDETNVYIFQVIYDEKNL